MDVDSPAPTEQDAAQFDAAYSSSHRAPSDSDRNENMHMAEEDVVVEATPGKFAIEGKIFVRKVNRASNYAILIFQGSEQLFIKGTADVRLVFGSAACFGFSLDRSYRTIISPHSTGLFSIESNLSSSISQWYAQHKAQLAQNWTEEDQELGLRTFIEHIVDKGSEEMANSISALVVIKTSTFLDTLAIFKDDIIGKPKSSPSTTDFTGLNGVTLIGNLEKSDAKFQIISPAWRQMTEPWESNAYPSEILVCGRKHVGKSTLMRYLVNVLLKKYGKVCLLDSDLGQAELTVPGFVSLSVVTQPLLGPSFANMHTAAPVWQESQFVGVSSAKDKLAQIAEISLMLYARYKYSNEAQFQVDLVRTVDEKDKFCESQQSSVTGPGLAPIIINSHGWIEGAGYAMLEHLIRNMAPALVLQLIPKEDAPIFHLSHFSSLGTKVETLRPVVSHASYQSIKSTEKRMKQTMSALVPGMKSVYRLPWSAFRFHLLDSDVPPSQLLYVLNGSLVALVVDSSPYTSLDQASQEAQALPSKSSFVSPPTPSSPSPSPSPLRPIDPTLPTFLLEPPSHISSHCVGVGIITSIDMHLRLFYLATSVPKALLLDVNTLVKGSIEVPPALLMASAIPSTPYLTADSLNAQGTGSANLKVRTNLVRGKAR